MILHAWRFASLLVLLPLVAACGPSDQHRTAMLLDNRLQATMRPDIAANRAAVQQLPDGALVTLFGASLFPVDIRTLDNRSLDVRASVIEGLLASPLMQVQIVDTSALPEDERATRVRNVAEYFADNGLASVLQPAASPQATPPGTPPGLTINIGVVCPHRHDGAGYDSGRAKPACN